MKQVILILIGICFFAGIGYIAYLFVKKEKE